MRQLDLSVGSGLLLPVHGFYITPFFCCCQSIFEHNTAQKWSDFIVGFYKNLCFLMAEKIFQNIDLQEILIVANHGTNCKHCRKRAQKTPTDKIDERVLDANLIKRLVRLIATFFLHLWHNKTGTRKCLKSVKKNTLPVKAGY